MLSPFSWLNQQAQTRRRRHKRQHCFPCMVISVGNIVSGGSGKTPFTIHLAELLTDRGYKVGVSHRGYKGTFEHLPTIISDGARVLYDVTACGDEAYLIASRLKGIPVVVGRMRTAAISLLLAAFPEIEIVIMDDGFQHLSVSRNLDIVCFDAETGIGNGLLLPAGYLREPLIALKEAGLVVINHKNTEHVDELDPLIRPYCGQIIHCQYRNLGFVNLEGKLIATGALADKPCYAISAIAHPDSFEASLKALKIKLLHHFCFNDHYGYNQPDVIDRIAGLAEKNGVAHLLCTEKDLMKLAKYPRIADRLLALRISLSSDQDDNFLDLVKEKL